MIYNEQAEKALLGALMQHQNPASLLLSLTEDDMVFEDDKIILAAMKRLAARREPFDGGVITAEAQKDSRCTPNTAAVVIQCMRSAPSIVMTESYYRTVKDASNRRKLQSIAQLIADRAQDMTQEAQTIIAGALDGLRAINDGKERWQEMDALVYQTFDSIERMSRGESAYLQSGVADLDRAIDGFFPGEMTILGARPAVGKSAFAAYIGANLARKGKRVGVCSLEMLPEQYMKRLLAGASGVDGHKLRTGKHLSDSEWEAIGNAVQELSVWQMPFTFRVRTVEDLAAEARRRKDGKGLDLLIVDYLQLLRTSRPAESNFAQVTEVSHQIKQLAIDMEIPILALAQVSRPEIKGRPRMPTLDSLRGSGDLEMDADAVLFLHRPEEDGDPSINPHHFTTAQACMRGDANQYIVCNVAKQRSGGNCMFDMIFDPRHMTYSCLAN